MIDSSFEGLGFYPADILLPADADMGKWAVVACDQFTSQPEYWQKVEEIVGDAPSTLRLILPESRLNEPDVDSIIRGINLSMEDYMKAEIFQTYPDALIYIERTQSDGSIRHGLIGMVDLDQYDFTPGSGALIRATEGTVLSRIPPRVRVRENAPIELPHIMLLIDDPEGTVIEPLTAAADQLEPLYDFDLMQDGGHIRGFLLDNGRIAKTADALRALCTSEEMEKKYGLKDSAPLLFAVGDGNHSLATAKQCYENRKKVTPEEQWADLPERYALVEVVNNHDDALKFEPIHRVVFGVDPEAVLAALRAYYPSAKITEEADEAPAGAHVIGYCYEGHQGRIIVPDPKLQLEVGTLQAFLDAYLKENPGEVDYIHGDEVTAELGSRPGNIGFTLPPMAKEALFKTVMADGVLPRKTFSMGHAQDKRYYIEARKKM